MKKNLIFPAILLTTFSTVYCQNTTNENLGSFKLDNSPTSLSVNVWKDKTMNIIFFKADFDLDADGSPRAYNESNTGLENNANGQDATTKKWFAVLTDSNGTPIKQSATDPFPGNYISTTSLENHGITDLKSARRYIDPEKVAFFVMPGGKPSKFGQMGINLGDIGLIYNTLTKKQSFAIFADSGPKSIIGEGSILLASKIGVKTRITSKGRIVGGLDEPAILYIVLPKSGKAPYQEVTQVLVDALGQKEADKLGGVDKIIQKALEQN
jgi:hypothetical protein